MLSSQQVVKLIKRYRQDYDYYIRQGKNSAAESIDNCIYLLRNAEANSLGEESKTLPKTVKTSINRVCADLESIQKQKNPVLMKEVIAKSLSSLERAKTNIKEENKFRYEG